MKILCNTILSCFACILITQNVFGQNTTKGTPVALPDDDIDYYDETQPYCFRFTWVGPEFDNSTMINTTCVDYLDNTRAYGVPCRQPLVVTYDGTPPDINFLWAHHKEKVLCRQSRGHVCAKYSYSFNNELQNITYMCTKVFARGEGAVTSGCYTQIINEYEVELCVCKSGTGPFKPCNAASTNLISLGLVIMFSILSMSNRYLQSFVT